MALTVTFKEGSRQKPSGSSCWDWKIIFCFGFLVLFGGNFLRSKLAGKLQGYIRPTFIFEKIADQKKNATFVLFFFVCVCVCVCVSGSGGRYWENYFQSEANWKFGFVGSKKNFAAKLFMQHIARERATDRLANKKHCYEDIGKTPTLAALSCQPSPVQVSTPENLFTIILPSKDSCH